MSSKPKIKLKYSTDGLQSMIHGVGDPERDKSASVFFVPKCISDPELIAAYEGNWMARALVDIPVMDSLRKGWQWAGEHHDAIAEEEKRLNVAGKLMQAFKKGRLLGGAAVYIGTDQDPAEPLELDRIQKGGIKYLNVMTRLHLNAEAIETDPEKDTYGTPKSYNISSESKGAVNIHPSRLVIFNGDERADVMALGSNTGWSGTSILQSTYDTITNTQGVHSSVASLLYEANIDVLGIPDLMANIGDAGYESEILKRLRLFALSKGINGMGVIDSEETLDRKSASFANLDKIMNTFATFVAAAGQIPATRFMSQAPQGLASSGESEMENYFDLISSKQTLEIDPAACNLFPALVRSALGTSEPIPRSWRPLRQMSEEQLSAIGKETAETVKLMVDSLAIEGNEAKALLIHKLSENGSFPHMQKTIDEALGSTELS